MVAEQFLRVAALQDPPTRLFRPSTALRVLLGNRRRRPDTSDRHHHTHGRQRSPHIGNGRWRHRRSGASQDRGAVVDHAKVNGVELEYEVVGSGEPMLFIHGAHIADALQPLVAEPALERFQRIRYHRRGLGGAPARSRRGRPASPSRPRTVSGSSTTSGWIVRTWSGTPSVERSPWNSRPSTPPGSRPSHYSNRCCSRRPPGRPSGVRWRSSPNATKLATPRAPCTASCHSRG